MTRKTIQYVVDPASGNRDAGAVFVLTEMSADRGARWAYRLLLMLFNAQADDEDSRMTEEMLHTGMAGVAALRNMVPEVYRAMQRLDYDKVAPLLDELMTCAKYQPPDTRLQPQAILSGDNCQIQEISTFFKLHWALLDLHTGFSESGGLQTLA